jgi:hypothetical protein
MRAKTHHSCEIAPVLVRFDHGARFIVNANERNFADKSARKAYNCVAGVGLWPLILNLISNSRNLHCALRSSERDVAKRVLKRAPNSVGAAEGD